MLALITFGAAGQGPDYNRMTLDLQVGVNNPVSPMSAGYDSPTMGFLTANIGGRYMLNAKGGIKLGLGYNRFSAKSGSLDFTTNYMRGSLEGVINLANILQFSQWTDRIGLLFHTGLGYSGMKSEDVEGKDRMLHATMGLAPQLRLSPRWALELDASVFAHSYQSRSYDFRQANYNRGVDGFLYNLTLGMQYHLGKKNVHADWVPAPDLTAEMAASKQRIAELEEKLRDDDRDGVANYLDEEPDTPEGMAVNTKGQTITQGKLTGDADGDGVPDESDICPGIKGKAELKGCPDTDNDGIADHLDRCPEVAGVASNAGCPGISGSDRYGAEKALNGIQFETGKDAITAAWYPVLEDVVRTMKENPACKLEITGHTDNQGPSEMNKELAERRASSVKNYFVEKGIDRSRIATMGKGDCDPVADNGSAEGRAKNRRVEFILRF